jgi:hypothetical protein
LREKRVDDFSAKLKVKNAFEVVTDEVHAAKFGTKNHLQRQKRERLPVVAAAV